jgi:hypothetical protein
VTWHHAHGQQPPAPIGPVIPDLYSDPVQPLQSKRAPQADPQLGAAAFLRFQAEVELRREFIPAPLPLILALNPGGHLASVEVQPPGCDGSGYT